MTPTASGRPLRFFGLLILGWIALRIVAVQMDGPMHPPPSPRSAPSSPPSFAMRPNPSARPSARTRARAKTHVFRHRPLRAESNIPTVPAELTSFSYGIAQSEYRPEDHYASDPTSRAGLVPLHPSPSRWRASAWLFWRNGSAVPNALSPGRLGASQAGMRVDFLPAPSIQPRVTAYGRITGALDHPIAPEAALGFSAQPMPHIPVSIGLERRMALGKGGRNANAVLIVGGFGPTALTSDIETEGYTQMGVVGLHSRDMFIDGKLSVLSPVGKTPIHIGGSLSGGAQPDLNRLDIGPELQWRFPLPNANARLAVEWRERIAGGTFPPSGLAVTLAADF